MSSSSSITANYQITLTWWTSYYQANKVDGVRLRFETSDATDVSDKIFAYLLMPLQPNDTSGRQGVFDHVCSPVDLAEYPEDEPIENHRPAWFRLNYVDIVVRSMAEAEDFVAQVLDDVRSLINTLKTMDTLLPGGTEVIS